MNSEEKKREALKEKIFKEYMEWLIRYQKDDNDRNFSLNQMRLIRDKYKENGFDIQDLKDITPGVIKVGWKLDIFDTNKE